MAHEGEYDLEKDLDEAISDDQQRLRRFDVIKRVMEQPAALKAIKNREENAIATFNYLKDEYKTNNYTQPHVKNAIGKWINDPTPNAWRKYSNDPVRWSNPDTPSSEATEFEYEPIDNDEAISLDAPLDIDDDNDEAIKPGKSLKIDKKKKHLQDLNVRILGAGTDVNQWKNRNINERQHRLPDGTDDETKRIVRGEYLNLNDDAWSDYVNQGWMQKGYERGAMFRLVTPVPEAMVDMHNQAASNGDWETYEKDMTNHSIKEGLGFWSQSQGRRTFFAQELVDAARAGYVIHHDVDTEGQRRQSVMPQVKSEMLTQIRDEDAREAAMAHAKAKPRRKRTISL